MAHTVYAVASGKGGVGKTATTANLGASLAAAGHAVVLVDVDLGMANLGGFVGVEADGPTLHEVLAGEADLAAATYEAPSGLSVVPSGTTLEGFAEVETAALSDAVGELRESFDYVLLDLGAGLSHDTVLPLALADAVVLVSTPQPLSVQDTEKTRQITGRLGGQIAGLVLTRAGRPGDMDLEDVETELGLPVLAMIPEDDRVPESASEGQSVLQFAPDSPPAEGYRGLAGIIEAESLAEAPVVPEIPEPEPEPEAAPAAAAGGGGTATTAEAAEPEAAEPEPEPGDAEAGDVEAGDAGLDLDLDLDDDSAGTDQAVAEAEAETEAPADPELDETEAADTTEAAGAETDAAEADETGSGEIETTDGAAAEAEADDGAESFDVEIGDDAAEADDGAAAADVEIGDADLTEADDPGTSETDDSVTVETDDPVGVGTEDPAAADAGGAGTDAETADASADVDIGEESPVFGAGDDSDGLGIGEESADDEAVPADAEGSAADTETDPASSAAGAGPTGSGAAQPDPAGSSPTPGADDAETTAAEIAAAIEEAAGDDADPEPAPDDDEPVGPADGGSAPGAGEPVPSESQSREEGSSAGVQFGREETGTDPDAADDAIEVTGVDTADTDREGPAGTEAGDEHPGRSGADPDDGDDAPFRVESSGDAEPDEEPVDQLFSVEGAEPDDEDDREDEEDSGGLLGRFLG